MRDYILDVDPTFREHMSIRQQEVVSQILDKTTTIPDEHYKRQLWLADLRSLFRSVDTIEGTEYDTGLGQELFRILNQARVHEQEKLDRRRESQKEHRKLVASEHVLPIQVKQQLYPVSPIIITAAMSKINRSVVEF